MVFVSVIKQTSDFRFLAIFFGLFQIFSLERNPGAKTSDSLCFDKRLAGSLLTLRG